MRDQNIFIIPYTTDEEYRGNVDKVLAVLNKTALPEEIVLTEGEYSYIYKTHDVVDYAKKYNLEHRYQGVVLNNLGSGTLSKVKYIVCIGTWASSLVDNYFGYSHPNVVVIHIQNAILPNQYRLDKYENLSRFNTTIHSLVNNLALQPGIR